MPASTLLELAATRAAHLGRTFYVLPFAGICRVRSIAPKGGWTGWIVSPDGERLPVGM